MPKNKGVGLLAAVAPESLQHCRQRRNKSLRDPEKESSEYLIRKLYTEPREVNIPWKRFWRPPESLARLIGENLPLYKARP